MKNNIDDLFKKKIDQLNDLPSEVSWNEEKGWNLYTQTYDSGDLHVRKKIWLMAAAALLTGFVLVFSILTNFQNKEITVKNTKDSPKEVKLPDGNIVWLNKQSTVSYSKQTSPELYQITITGEAFIEIIKLKSKEYRVIAENSIVITSHTATFNIDANKNKDIVNISVSEGAIKVCELGFEEGLALLVTAGNYGSVHKEYKVVYVANSDDENYMAWKTGQFVFNNTEMETVADILSKYYNNTIELENESLAYCTFSGTYDADSIKQILSQLKEQLQCEIRDDGNKILISGIGCL